MVRLRVKVRVRFTVRENRILDGNQFFGSHEDSYAKLCVCVNQSM